MRDPVPEWDEVGDKSDPNAAIASGDLKAALGGFATCHLLNYRRRLQFYSDVYICGFGVVLWLMGDRLGAANVWAVAYPGGCARGRRPRLGPVGVTRIGNRYPEWHDLDTNIGHGTFASGDAQRFRDVLQPLPADTPLRNQRLSRRDFERRGYVFYRHQHFDIAVNWSRRVGEFWLVYSHENRG
jgi:hypothetical protein